MTPKSSICLDASLVIRLLTHTQDQALKAQFQSWQANHQMLAPHLLYFEVANALYQYQRHNFLSETATQNALVSAQALPIQLFSDQLLHQQALQLATSHNLSATYDAHYLALAQRFEAELWTADKKLFNSVSVRLSGVKLWQ